MRVNISLKRIKMFISRYKKEEIRTSLIFIFLYPIVCYLIFTFVSPFFFSIYEFSKNVFSGFPFIIIHGLIAMILGLGCFFLFIVGLYIWIISLYNIGLFLWEVSFKENRKRDKL